MKKLLTVVAAILVAASMSAQIGVVAGITSSETNIKDATASVSTVNQYHLGLAMKFDLGLFAIQPELLYNVKGQSIEAIDKDVFKSMSYKTGYLELPVQIQAGVKFGKLARAFAFAEPFVGYALTNEVKASSTGDTAGAWKSTWEDVKNRSEYGLGLGCGVEAFETVQLSLKYFWNFGAISDGFSWDEIMTGISTGKCNGIAASVAIFF